MKRVVGWGVFAAFLVAVAAFVHAVAEPVPTWSHVAPAWTLPALDRTLAGGVFVTRVSPPDGVLCGPLTARSPDSGAEHFTEGDEGDIFHPLRDATLSLDGRRAAFPTSGDWTLLWLDAAQARRLTFESAVQTALSPDGERLLVEERDNLRPVEEPSRLHLVRWNGERRTLRAARMGSLRWPPDGAFFTFHDGGGVVLYDPARRRGLSRIPVGAIYGLSPHGKALWGSRGDGCELWRLDDPAHPRRTAIVPGEAHAFPEFAPDGGLWFLPQSETEEDAKTARLHVWDVARGAKRWDVPFPERGFWGSTFSPCGRYAALRPTTHRAVAWPGADGSFDRRGAERWRLSSTEGITFPPEGDALIHAPERGRPHGDYPPSIGGITPLRDTVDALDSAGGTPRLLARVPFSRITAPRFTPGRVWLHADEEWPDIFDPPWWLRWVSWLRPTPGDDRGLLLGLSWPAGRTAFRLSRPELSSYLVADDGSYVITFQTFSDHTRLCRWEVPARKPWFWIVGVPLIVGVSLLGLRTAWTRYRTPTADPNRSRDPAT